MNTTPPASSFEHLAVIRAQGPDAASFLQGQLSNDFVLLKPLQWQLAAYCSPKGRMLASFWGIKLTSSPESQDICLVLSKDIAQATLKRLSIFVMRAKLTLQDASECLPQLLANHGLAAWAEREVERGVARITAAIADALVPQMLNYESIGGVSFKKGCYPGQEVVARSQFRGAIKRRTYLVQVTSDKACEELAEAAGQEVFSFDEEDPVGLVVQTQANKALVCIRTSSAKADLRLGTKHGLTLKMLALPYQLLDDI